MQVGASESLMLLIVGLTAGALGALVGIGGGIIVVPALALGFGYDIRIAVATSLLAVVATSVTAGIGYAREGLTNVRLGLTLETATTVGGVVGGLVAVSVAPSVIAGVFSVVMIGVAVLMWRHVDIGPSATPISGPRPASGTSGRLALSGRYFDRAEHEWVDYEPGRLGIGMSLSSIAGLLSGLLGVGGGFLKVPAMTIAMRVPTKAAAATSNFMVGITAVASLFIYLTRGFVEPNLVVPVVTGIIVGALIASRLANRVEGVHVQRVLAVILVLVAVQMGIEAIPGSLYG
jgi:uncharacterized protein